MIRGMARVCWVLPRLPGAPLIITDQEASQPRTLVADFHSSRGARAKLLR